MLKLKKYAKNCLLKPNDLYTYNLLTSSYLYCKDYHMAMNYLVKANDMFKHCPDNYNRIGYCYYMTSKYERALKYFTATIILGDSSVLNHWFQCNRLLIKSDLKHEILNGFKTVLTLKPKFTIVRNEYALCLVSLGREQEAEEQYKIAIDNDPTFVNNYNDLGNVLYNTNRLKEANDCYKKASELNQTLRKTWTNLGITYMNLKENQNAIVSFQKAIALCPQNTLALQNLVDIYLNKNNYSLVIDYYKKALEILPYDVHIHSQLGLV